MRIYKCIEKLLPQPSANFSLIKTVDILFPQMTLDAVSMETEDSAQAFSKQADMSMFIFYFTDQTLNVTLLERLRI